MKIGIILLCILPFVLAGCKNKISVCSCNNITSEHYQPNYGMEWTDQPDGLLFHKDGAGCKRELTCYKGSFTYFESNWIDTTIPPPDYADDTGVKILSQDLETYSIGPYVELQELFGIVCENSKWVITKYPFGFSYMKKGTGEEIQIPGEEMTSKTYKTFVKKFYCDG
ncbi:hypothetical protein L5515_015111 [Caenorhabditis briggsae]|uniref:Lipoprotein n=1 Tax=Caenorhabditis briggsae TaxID=6238 RepID=A0AAE9J7R1_CAEBR|nr:hypothetical protein L5515_015111 [Caenorhabditis briggsae]